MENTSRQLKEKLLDMFRWFHGFCQEQGLRYYILGGTMLGAVRHQGFIPWDDDIDIGMPRQDYRRLEQILKDQGGKYVLETPNTGNPDYFYPFSKLYDTETTLIENTRCQIRRGIYLDIFPLDGGGNSHKEALSIFRKVKWRRMLLLAMTTGLRRDRGWAKNLCVRVMGMVPDWLVDRKKLLLSLNERCGRKPLEQCQWSVNYMGNWMEREIMPTRMLGTPVKYTFEGLEAWGPADWDGYLTALYGDWRKLPPEEKRTSHHDFLYLDLERGYLEKGGPEK